MTQKDSLHLTFQTNISSYSTSRKISCLPECEWIAFLKRNEILFDQFLLLWCHSRLFNSKKKEQQQQLCIANDWNNKKTMKYIQAVCRLSTVDN